MTLETDVVSSNLKHICHDERSTLTVYFHNGGIYEYYNVPVSVYYDLINAESKGQALNKYVKMQNYPYKCICKGY